MTKRGSGVTPQVNFLWKITFDTLYTNRFSNRIRSRTLSISSELSQMVTYLFCDLRKELFKEFKQGLDNNKRCC